MRRRFICHLKILAKESLTYFDTCGTGGAKNLPRVIETVAGYDLRPPLAREAAGGAITSIHSSLYLPHAAPCMHVRRGREGGKQYPEKVLSGQCTVSARVAPLLTSLDAGALFALCSKSEIQEISVELRSEARPGMPGVPCSAGHLASRWGAGEQGLSPSSRCTRSGVSPFTEFSESSVKEKASRLSRSSVAGDARVAAEE